MEYLIDTLTKTLLSDKDVKYLLEDLSKEKDTPKNLKEIIASLTQYMIDQGMNVSPLPKLIIKNSDLENAENVLGKTAYYNPNNCSIVLYTLNRHPKDIGRSFSHEMIHRIQDNEGRLTNVTTSNTNEDSSLKELEEEAYLRGNMTFRNWEDSIKNKSNLTEGKFDKITGLIVDKIWQYIKKSKSLKSPTNVYKTTINIGKYTFYLTTFIKRSNKYNFQLAVDANQKENEIQVLINLNPDYEPDSYVKLNSKLQDAIRHEIEHTLQDPKSTNFTPGKPKMTSPSYRGEIQHDPKKIHRYFTLKDEIPAMVNGLYRQAKTEKKPIDEVFKEYLQFFLDSGDINQQQLDKIIKVWSEYTKVNLPAAKFSTDV
jgi:hypothetical protein